MSPEQAEGKEVDARSDIFSFGSVLYEMVTGRRAFQGDTKVSTMAAILKEEPQPPSQIVQALPQELERIVRRCLRKDRSQRFQHMDDLKVALEELKQELKQELDSGALEPSSSVVRKRRPYRVFGSLIITFLALGAATWYWFHRSRPTPSEASLAAVPLTSYSGVEESPSFSPDGSQVAFSWNGDKQDNYDIYAKLIGTENRLHLTTHPARDYSPAWSPDGRWIAFRRDLPGLKVAVLLIPPIGGPERLLTETYSTEPTVFGPFLAWSPDSHSLVIVDCDGPNKPAGLLLFSVETNEKRRLTSPPGNSIADSGPAFSPDGHSLVFSRESRSSSSDLYLLNLSDDLDPIGEPGRLAFTNQRPLSPVWTSDGNEIVFFSRSGMSSGLWRTPVSKPAQPWKLAFAPDLARTPAISRQGNRLAYAVESYDDNIWRVDLRGPDQKPASPVRFISSTRRDFTAEYSPDGKRIAFVSDRSGTREIWVCDRDGLNATKLTSFGGPMVRGQKWSPNSQNIAFMMNRGGTQDIYVIGASGGAARPLVTGPANDHWPYWSRDGQWLYFRSARKGESEIWKVPTKGGEEIQVTRDDLADFPHESPDEKWLYYSKGWPGPQSVWRIPVEGGEPTKILDAVHHIGLWTVGKEGIYYFSVTDEKGHTDINLYEFATGNKKKLLTIDSPEPEFIAVSPDRQSILFTKLDESGSDLMLVENFR